MPSHGENPLARFAHALVHEDGFTFGDPRLSDDGSLVSLPVRKTAAGSRSYVLVSEASDSVTAVDIGRIDRLRVRNDSWKTVLLPPGTVFEGRGTAARATCAGVLLDAGSTCELRVRCIQASQAVVEAVNLRPAAILAPHAVAQALLTLDQGLVWSTAETADAGSTPALEIPGALDAAEVGVVVLDADGVVAAEVCADASSWRALARPWRPSRNSATPLPLNPAESVRVAKAFLEGVPRHTFHAIGRDAWVAHDARVADTVLDGQVVHLIAFGRDLTCSRPTGPHDVEPRFQEAEVSLSAPGVPIGAQEPEGAEVAAMATVSSEGLEVSPPSARPRRRKVLTSGWDPPTFDSLERYAHKEFRGDRSAAIRFLIRRGLDQRGYMGPHGLPAPSFAVEPAEAREPSPAVELGRAAAEARIRDFERIVLTESYAPWLRKRARFELEQVVSAGSDELLRSAAQSALDRLPAEAAFEEPAGPEEIEPEEIPPSAALPPAPPPADIRPLLRRAFAESASGRYPEALTLFDEALVAEPDNRTALLGRAVALRRSGKAQDALDALDRVLEAEPSNAAALLNRGRVLQERGDLEGALDAFDRLASAAPNDWDVWMARGEVLARLGRDKAALEAFSEALRRNPDDESIRTRIHTLELARSAAAPRPLPRVPLPRDLQEGQSYLVKEPRPDRSLRVVRALLSRAVPSLLVTGRSADRIRKEAGLAGTQILELSHTPGEGRHDPTALAGLTQHLEHFVRENHGHGVILLDGLPILMRENGFRESALFLERVHETVLLSHAIFLISVAPGDLTEKEAALLERNLRTLA